MTTHSDRRRFLAITAVAMGASLAVPDITLAAAESKEEDEVEAAEDLMREHGVLRRALLVYAEAAVWLAHGRKDLPLPALGQTATLFRAFGEDYHERSLEEQHVFPVLTKLGGKNATLAATLKQQHDRDREITNYLSAIVGRGRVGAADSTPLANALTSFVRMYEHHAAIEDTIVFPTWKQTIAKAKYRELSEEFEELEQRMFGKDGFDDAVDKIGIIEQAFGLDDLARLTAPAPPALR